MDTVFIFLSFGLCCFHRMFAAQRLGEEWCAVRQKQTANWTERNWGFERCWHRTLVGKPRALYAQRWVASSLPASVGVACCGNLPWRRGNRASFKRMRCGGMKSKYTPYSVFFFFWFYIYLLVINRL